MSRESQIVDAEVDILAVARRYQLGWRERGGDRPFQIHCPMHADSTPSARCYPRSNSLFCWTCQRSIGPVGLVSTLEGVSFRHAVDMLSSWYGVNIEPDLDEEEARRLIGLAEGRRPAQTIEERAELRRVAGLVVRAADVPWVGAEQLLVAYELLDLTDVDPQDWLDVATTTLNERVSVE